MPTPVPKQYIGPTSALILLIVGWDCWRRITVVMKWFEICGCALTNQATGGSVLQVVVLSEQGDNLGENGFAHQLPVLVFGHDTGPHLDLLTHLRLHRLIC